MSRTIHFTCYGKAEPQGSVRAFVVKGKARLTSDNQRLHSFRQEIASTALNAQQQAWFFAANREPVRLVADFFLLRPASIPKRRREPVVKPDLDKLLRALCDALSGILYEDDAQVVQVSMTKQYGLPRVEVTLETI